MKRAKLAVAIGVFTGTLWGLGLDTSEATPSHIVNAQAQTQLGKTQGLELASSDGGLVEPLVIAKTDQTVSGHFEGCWEGMVGKQVSCAPQPCDPGTWRPEEYKFCFRREADNVLRVDQALGSFCGRGELLVEKIDNSAVTMTGKDAPTPDCSLTRKYRVTLSNDWQTLRIHEDARLFQTTSPGSPLSPQTDYIFDAVFRRVGH